jgi:signal transduction histidine kinase
MMRPTRAPRWRSDTAGDERLKNRARDTKEQEFLDDPVASDPALRVSGVQARAPRHASVAPDAERDRVVPSISIGAPADPALLDPTYAYLSAYCSALLSPQVAQRMNVAIYELYANALRYGSRAGEVRLELSRSADGKGASLRVTNFTEPEQLTRLREQVARVRDDAAGAFDEEMNRFAGASQPPPMLGIVRIAHESALPLELTIVGSRVEVSIRCDG